MTAVTGAVLLLRIVAARIQEGPLCSTFSDLGKVFILFREKKGYFAHSRKLGSQEQTVVFFQRYVVERFYPFGLL